MQSNAAPTPGQGHNADTRRNQVARLQDQARTFGAASHGGFRRRRTAGVAIAYTIILGITLAFFAILVPVLYMQVKDFASNMAEKIPPAVQKGVTWLQLKLPEDEAARPKERLLAQFAPGDGG